MKVYSAFLFRVNLWSTWRPFIFLQEDHRRSELGVVLIYLEWVILVNWSTLGASHPGTSPHCLPLDHPSLLTSWEHPAYHPATLPAASVNLPTTIECVILKVLYNRLMLSPNFCFEAKHWSNCTILAEAQFFFLNYMHKLIYLRIVFSAQNLLSLFHHTSIQ